MAYELHGLLAGNVSIVTGENIKPSYGGDDESFLRKVITPIYRVIDKVIRLIYLHFLPIQFSFLRMFVTMICSSRKPKKAKMEKHRTQIGAIMMI